MLFILQEIDSLVRTPFLYSYFWSWLDLILQDLLWASSLGASLEAGLLPNPIAVPFAGFSPSLSYSPGPM